MPLTSPLLDLPGAVAAEGIDAGVAAHYGSFNREQRTLAPGDGFVDLSHRDVLRIAGPDRLTWLHSLTTQHLTDLPARDLDAVAGAQPAGPRRARLHRRRRRRGAHRPHRARRRQPAAGVPAADGLHDARRDHRRDRRARGHVAAEGLRPGAARAARRRTPRRPARPAGSGPSRRCGSRAASRGSAWTPTTARSPTRPAGSRAPSTSTRAATAARRRSRGSTRWAGRRAG